MLRFGHYYLRKGEKTLGWAHHLKKLVVWANSRKAGSRVVAMGPGSRLDS